MTKEFMDDALANAEELLKKTQCKLALTNYNAIKDMRKMLLSQESALNKLVDMAADAAQTSVNYKRIIDIVKTSVSKKTWQHILAKTHRRLECESHDAT